MDSTYRHKKDFSMFHNNCFLFTIENDDKADTLVVHQREPYSSTLIIAPC